MKLVSCGKSPSEPLSPHILIYKLPLSAIISVMHRATGVALHLVVLTLVFLSSAYILSGSEHTAYGCIQKFYGTITGRAFVLLLGMMMLFHMTNGIKYIIMDVFIGKLFNKRNINISIAVVMLITVLLSGIFGFVLFKGI